MVQFFIKMDPKIDDGGSRVAESISPFPSS